MKRILSAFLGVVLLGAVLSGCGETENSSEADSVSVASSAETKSSQPASQGLSSQTSAPTATTAAEAAEDSGAAALREGAEASGAADSSETGGIIAQKVSDYAFTGVVLATQNGQTAYSSGDRSALYHVCSVSKQFTAAAVLILQEEGKLDISSTINLYYPEYAHGGEITISQLLSMNSGIPDYIDLAEDGTVFANGVSAENTSEQNRAAIKQAVFSRELLFTPGEKYYYCNTNYLLLAEIVTAVSGIPYEDFIRQRMLEPMGMTSTGFGDTRNGCNITGEGSYGYDWFRYKGCCYGCGDMISNAADLEKWGHEYIDNKVLSDSIISQMTADHSGGYGYGMIPDSGNGFVYHDGNLPPYCSTLSVSRGQKIVLVMLDCNFLSPLISLRQSLCDSLA